MTDITSTTQSLADAVRRVLRAKGADTDGVLRCLEELERRCVEAEELLGWLTSSESPFTMDMNHRVRHWAESRAKRKDVTGG
jgi:hypothetical protein